MFFVFVVIFWSVFKNFFFFNKGVSWKFLVSFCCGGIEVEKCVLCFGRVFF